MISMNTIPAEKSICSTLLFNIKALEVLQGVLLVEHFFDETCRDIYSIITEVYLSKGSMTDIAMVNRLPTKEREIIDIALMTPVSNDTLLL
ncbi:MAG TPA: hypothetical protein EYP39_01090, partial [Ghiorsea sp.]|nr:hypothetical protein [Ghiorsea sp.]